METACKGTTPCFSLNGNVLYNLRLKLHNLSPYILAGCAAKNALPFYINSSNKLFSIDF
jgi:hypothetical protein